MIVETDRAERPDLDSSPSQDFPYSIFNSVSLNPHTNYSNCSEINLSQFLKHSFSYQRKFLIIPLCFELDNKVSFSSGIGEKLERVSVTVFESVHQFTVDKAELSSGRRDALGQRRGKRWWQTEND